MLLTTQKSVMKSISLLCKLHSIELIKIRRPVTQLSIEKQKTARWLCDLVARVKWWYQLEIIFNHHQTITSLYRK